MTSRATIVYRGPDGVWVAVAPLVPDHRYHPDELRVTRDLVEGTARPVFTFNGTDRLEEAEFRVLAARVLTRMAASANSVQALVNLLIPI